VCRRVKTELLTCNLQNHKGSKLASVLATCPHDGFFCFRRSVLAPHVVVPDDDKAIRVLAVSPELDVSPLYGDKLAAAKASTQGHQKRAGDTRSIGKTKISFRITGPIRRCLWSSRVVVNQRSRDYLLPKRQNSVMKGSVLPAFND
jgi:hypothetical protein